MLERLKSRARALKAEIQAVYLAAIDPRTPWYAKALILLIVAYALSPIDLIPDFIPVLGYLDDVILIPAGITLALRMIPPQVMADARLAARDRHESDSMRYAGAAIILGLWILAIILVVVLIRRLIVDR